MTTRRPSDRAAIAVAAFVLASAGISIVREPPASASMDPVARGRYITRNVAMCTDCHGATLRGGAVPGTPIHAPSLAQGAHLSREAIATILETGSLPPPMPHFGMTPEDAGAVAAYLLTVH